MLLSMTGFGKAVVEHDGRKITVEIKSLNSKQMDLNMKLPPMLREVELELRNRISRRLERGKVDVVITMESIGGENGSSLNLKAMADYKAQIEEASDLLGIPRPTDWYSLLLRMPEVLVPRVDNELETDIVEVLESAVDEAVEALMQFRTCEGNKLMDFFGVRVDAIGKLLAQVPRYETERVEKIRARIEENLGKLSLGGFDPSRLEQEMIFYIEKLDVNEEKQRLQQHLNYFMETMDGNYGQGKKLGFIAQEMGREINTLGSKSNHAQLQRLVVRMKDELEQIKEQVLNVM